MTRLLKHWKRWAALGAAFFLVVLLWLALVAGRVAGEPLRLTLWADYLPIDQAAGRAPGSGSGTGARLCGADRRTVRHSCPRRPSFSRE